MSDTPRTDNKFCELVAWANGISGWRDVASEMAKHGFMLERELNAAKAEIARLNRDVLDSPVVNGLVDALKTSTEYVKASHGALVGCVGHNNVVLPDVEKCQDALKSYDMARKESQ